MLERIEFLIPGVPVPKGRPRFSKFGPAFTPARTRAYEKLVKDIAIETCKKANWLPTDDDISVYIEVTRARKSGDLENFIKSVLDGFNKVVFTDDRHVSAINACRFDDKNNPCVYVEVTRWTKS